MALQLYNTLTRKKDQFKPINPGKIDLYVCGITVYDYCHIGHARVLVAFDAITRYLRSQDWDVNYVRNITDIDDKILQRADENKELYTDLTARMIDAMHEDERALGILPPNLEPRATRHMDDILDMVQTLVDNHYAYRADNGDVYYRVKRFPDYGKLSNKNPDELLSGARVGVTEAKEDPRDFALWKAADKSEAGWPSPWGYGRPGWHIECSVMSEATLGITFDIHGGGRDLIFPHHENEVAQSCCAHDGAPFARYWVHNGFLTVEGDKMSKSLGNFRTVRELLEEAPGEALRLNMLSAQYRQPLDWTAEGVKRAKASLDRLYTALQHLEDIEAGPIKPAAGVIAALEDDLNTPQALTELYALAGEANKATDGAEKARIKGLLLGSGNLLGLLQQSPKEWFQSITVHLKADSIEARSELSSPVLTSVISKENIETLIAERDEAKKQKNYKRADEIRDNLKAAGIILEDGPGGTTWKRA
jgi:cysteinyl-tRNA synthetase